MATNPSKLNDNNVRSGFDLPPKHQKYRVLTKGDKQTHSSQAFQVPRQKFKLANGELPSNAYYETYYRLDSLMHNLPNSGNNQLGRKSSLRNLQSCNSTASFNLPSQRRSSAMNESLCGESPLYMREFLKAAQLGQRHSVGVESSKQVNFALAA